MTSHDDVENDSSILLKLKEIFKKINSPIIVGTIYLHQLSNSPFLSLYSLLDPSLLISLSFFLFFFLSFIPHFHPISPPLPLSPSISLSLFLCLIISLSHFLLFIISPLILTRLNLVLYSGFGTSHIRKVKKYQQSILMRLKTQLMHLLCTHI